MTDKLPPYIKQDGYIAEWDGELYQMNHMNGGHMPGVSKVTLTYDEMKTIFEDRTKFDAIVVEAKKRQK